MLTAWLVLLLQLTTPPGIVEGTVRSDPGGQPIAGAQVLILDASAAAVTDSAGGYVLHGVRSGVHRLRITAHDYRTLDLDVLTWATAAVRVDVSLAQEPARLIPVEVFASRRAHAPTFAGTAERELADGGAWRVSASELHATPALEDPDPFRMLATAPGAPMLVESPASVHVRGGAADENLFLLDGAPVYSPVHPGAALSAFNPDIVDDLVVHGAAPSAAYGGRLSSVIEVRTPASIPSMVVTRGAVTPGAVRGTVELPLFPGHVGMMLSGRHSVEGLLAAERAELAMPGVWSDLFGKLTARIGANELSAEWFSSENGLGFATRPDESDTSPIDATRNSFEWASATGALAWRRPLGARASLETRLWHARFDGAAGWRSDGGLLALGSELRTTGSSAAVTVLHASGHMVAGIEVERIAAGYHLNAADALSSEGAAAAATDSVVGPLLHLASAPTLTSFYAEDRRQVAPGWTLSTGVRGTLTPGGTARLEPRLSATYQPSARFGVSLGYARMHQYSQSLRNEESLLGTVLGPDLAVAVGAAGLPVARSDELATSATFALGAAARLRLDGYARRLRDVVLVAPATGEPFATRGYAVGDGRAWGIGASLARETDRLSLEGRYALGGSSRRAGVLDYRPSFAPRQSASLALGYRAGARTRLRGALWATSGRGTTPIGDEVQWDTRDAFVGGRELGGTPRYRAGALGAAQLPPYVRLDLGIRHSMPVARARGEVTGFASLENALGRKNATGYVAPGGTAPRRPLAMLPPSFVVGLAWRY